MIGASARAAAQGITEGVRADTGQKATAKSPSDFLICPVAFVKIRCKQSSQSVHGVQG